MYVVGYVEGILRVFPCIPNREVEPLIIAICIGVILHKESVVIRCVLIEEGALKVPALEA